MTSTAIAIRQSADLTQDQVDLLKRTICKGATEDELLLFQQVCNRLRLDPFARQIYAVKRWDKKEGREVMAIQVSIDGMRLVAQRTGEYRGQTEHQWCGSDGKWVNVWLSQDAPSAARVGVHREGFVEPLYAVARFSSYVARTKEGMPSGQWRDKPEVMISKCCEALALRRAFPNELSGVYSEDEMDQAGRAEVVTVDQKPAPAAPQKNPIERTKERLASAKPKPEPDNNPGLSVVDALANSKTLAELDRIGSTVSKLLEGADLIAARAAFKARKAELQQAVPHDDKTGEVFDYGPPALTDKQIESFGDDGGYEQGGR